MLAEVIRDIPNLNFIYFADSAFAPYGTMTKEQLTARLKQIISQFKSQINMVVLACNTATTNSIDILRTCFSFQIIGSEPAIKPAAKISEKIMLVCTPLTAKSKRLDSLIMSCNKPVKIFAPKHLAYCIDNFYLNNNRHAKVCIDKTIENVIKNSCDCQSIVLGCTHYCFLKDKFKEKTKLPILDGNFGIKQQVKKHITLSNLSEHPNHKFVSSAKNKELVKKYQIIFLQTLAKLTDV